MGSWEYIEEIILMFSLLAVVAFCSAAETAYSAAKSEELDAMSKKKKYGARMALKLLKNYDSALVAVLIANTVVCIALSSVGAVIFGDMINDDEYGAAVSGAILTVLILLFGEISPKLLAKEAAAKFACFLAWPLYIVTILMAPLCYLTTLWKILLVKVFKLKSANE